MLLTDRKVVHRGHYRNNLVEVIDRGDERSLLFAGSVVQSAMSISSPQSLVLSYTRYMMAPLLIDESPRRALVIGIGAGSLLRYISHHLPQCRVDAIDCSAHIIKLARGYFHLPDKETVAIHCRDGFDFLRERVPDDRYDLILIDAFDAGGMSLSIYRPEFFALCRDHLQPEGAASINLWSGDKNRMAAVAEAIGAHFASLVNMPVPNRGNVVCLAGKEDTLARLFERNRLEIETLSERFDLDFKAIMKVCSKNNLGLFQRLNRLLL